MFKEMRESDRPVHYPGGTPNGRLYQLRERVAGQVMAGSTRETVPGTQKFLGTYLTRAFANTLGLATCASSGTLLHRVYLMSGGPEIGLEDTGLPAAREQRTSSRANALSMEGSLC